MKVFAFGASRHIGYHACLTLLNEGHEVVYFMRNPAAFDQNVDMQPFIQSGAAKLIKGDTLNEDDVRNAWRKALDDGKPVDLILFTIGGTPSFCFSKGFVTHPPNLCTLSLFNILSTAPSALSSPKLIIISTHGSTSSTHSDIPLLSRPGNSLIHIPHQDKLGMERLVRYTTSAPWTDEDPETWVLPDNWKTKVSNTLLGEPENAVIVRPGWLTDHEETGNYRVGEKVKGLYFVSRKDVAHFITSKVVKNWAKYGGKGISIGYSCL